MDSYLHYIHTKLKKMSLMERVNAQSKQIQLVQKINYENLKKQESKDTQVVLRTSYKLDSPTPIGQQELMEATIVSLSGLEQEKLFNREELYDSIYHLPNDPNKRKTGQEKMMAAMYGESSLPNSKDVVEM